MSEKIPMERHNYDVLVIGAGGAGLRAAVEAREAGLRVAIICKSLFGKAHTVMAEGGIAASMGNVNDKDGWQVHFRDTMRGGKFLNHYHPNFAWVSLFGVALTDLYVRQVASGAITNFYFF